MNDERKGRGEPIIPGKSQLFDKLKNSVVSAIVLSVIISLVLMMIFKNRMFLFIIPFYPLQVLYRKLRDRFRDVRKDENRRR